MVRPTHPPCKSWTSKNVLQTQQLIKVTHGPIVRVPCITVQGTSKRLFLGCEIPHPGRDQLTQLRESFGEILYFISELIPFTRCSEKCQGYIFFGVQGLHWCWCGNTAPPAGKKRPESECYKECPGDSDYKCGDSWRMNIYKQG